MTEKRDRIVAEYKARGISLDLSGISSLIVEQQTKKLDQLVSLLPEFEKLTPYVARLEIVIGVNRYSAETKRLAFVLNKEQLANEAYLRAFGKMRSYELSLGGPEIDEWSAAQSAEAIENIISVCQSLYIRTDASAEAASSELELARKWNLLSVALSCEVIDSTADSLLRLDFEPALDVLIQKLDLMRPVGVKLNVPFEFTKGVMNEPSILRSGMRLLLESLDTLVSRRERFKGFKLTELPDSRIDQDGILWIGSDQKLEDFRSFVDAL